MFPTIKSFCIVCICLSTFLACKKESLTQDPPVTPPADNTNSKDNIIGWWKPEKLFYGTFYASAELYFGADHFYYDNADDGLYWGSATGTWDWDENNTIKVNCNSGWGIGSTFFFNITNLTADSVWLTNNNNSARYYKLDSAAITDKNELMTAGGIFRGSIYDNNGDGGPVKDAIFGEMNGLYLSATGDLYVTSGGIRKINASDSIVTTVAGGGNTYEFGDGGPAIDATFDHPGEVVMDSKGNLLICDAGYNCIRKVDGVTNIINTIAGDHGPYGGGFSGDGGPAVNASFNTPSAITLDANENIYICDRWNHCIRKIDAETGIITTVAGVGKPYEGGFSGDGGLATAAHLDQPTDVVFDAEGNLFIADFGNNRLRKVSAIDGTISTVAGTGVIGSYDDGVLAKKAPVSIFSLAIDALGNIFFVDGDRLRKIDKATGKIYTLAGDGLTPTFPGEGSPATAFSLSGKTGIVINKNGEIYFSDNATRQIRKVLVR